MNEPENSINYFENGGRYETNNNKCGGVGVWHTRSQFITIKQLTSLGKDAFDELFGRHLIIFTIYYY